MSEFCKGCTVPTAYIVLAFERKNKIIGLDSDLSLQKYKHFAGMGVFSVNIVLIVF
jgi:hypothetical protein